MRSILRAALFAASLCAGAVSAQAPQPEAPDPQLGETVVFVRTADFFPVELETTVFRPEGAGPFPVVVINHGKAAGRNSFQPRARYTSAAREFLQRGYAVVVPMRKGFSKSGGSVVGEGCNIAGAGEAQADDLKSVAAWLRQQPWADASRMVMMGQSHGGLATLAYAQQPDPGFRLFVNFAGGLKWETGCQWQVALKDAYGSYGRKTRVPTIWFYGENDSYFPPPVIRPAYDAYVAAGAPGQMVAYGPFGADAHGMFGSWDGVRIWWPVLERKLVDAGLPVAVTHPQYAPDLPVPAATAFAPIDDVAKVPYLKDAGRDGYRTFLAKGARRAFAIAPDGAWAWSEGGADPLRRALATCNRKGGGACRLYAVGDDVVWTSP